MIRSRVEAHTPSPVPLLASSAPRSRVYTPLGERGINISKPSVVSYLRNQRGVYINPPSRHPGPRCRQHGVLRALLPPRPGASGACDQRAAHCEGRAGLVSFRVPPEFPGSGWKSAQAVGQGALLEG